MAKIRLTAPKMTPKLAEYVETFGHKPSFETYKYKTGAEIEEMADVALLRKKPVKSWANRPSELTGTLLDDLYKQDTDIQDPSLPRAEPEVSEKISKKELRKAAIQEHDESLDSSPKRFYSKPNQDYSITNSQASNLRWKQKPANGELMDGKPKKARSMEESPSITSSSSLTPRVIKKIITTVIMASKNISQRSSE